MKKKFFYSVSVLLILFSVLSVIFSYIEEEKRITSQPGYSGVDLLSLVAYPFIMILVLGIELNLLTDIKFFIGLSEKRNIASCVIRSILLLMTVTVITILYTGGLVGEHIKLAENMIVILFVTSTVGRAIYSYFLYRQKNGKHQ